MYLVRMVKWETIVIIKTMTVWNYIVESYNLLSNKCKRHYNYIKNYFYGYYDIWGFIPGHTLPLSLNNMYNYLDVNWIYNNFDNSLIINTNIKSNMIKCNFEWLSSKIVITNSTNSDKPYKKTEYDIDDFLEQFMLNTFDNITPSLYTIFMTWCIYTKQWFKYDDLIEFHIIDNNGDEIILNTKQHNNSLTIKHNKIIIDKSESLSST